MSRSATTRLRFYDLEPETDTLRKDVLAGLSLAQKRIPPKYFYDERGSRLFEKICATNAYYPTRTEMAILETHLEEICSCLDPECVLVEPGSGSSRKVRLILDRLEPHTYMPLDISSDFLKSVAHGLARDYPRINVTAACVDYTAPIDLPCVPPDRRRIAFFPGSSIGNFEPGEAATFLGNLADLVGRGGGLLIGVDLRKDASVLTRAYNDEEGLTASFNLNLLAHINRELGADFDFDAFGHEAFYDEDKGRVEMHLVSRCSQSVFVAGHRFLFTRGESIHTENSYKYTVEGFQEIARRAGFRPRQVWTDPRRWFSVQYFDCPG